MCSVEPLNGLLSPAVNSTELQRGQIHFSSFCLSCPQFDVCEKKMEKKQFVKKKKKQFLIKHSKVSINLGFL